jgi:hypothetical protein
VAEQYVKVNLLSLAQFREAIAADLRLRANGPIRQCLHQWAAVYRAAMQDRFDRYSKGGGDWPGLAESTKRRRRGPRKGHKGERSFTILRDTGTLFAALTPAWQGKPGAIQRDTPFGIRVGYGGPHKYVKGATPPSIADIASFHQNGGGRLPKREIIVNPESATYEKMLALMEAAVAKLAKDTGNQ